MGAGWNKGDWKYSDLSKENLEELYLIKQLSAPRIAKIIGCSEPTVYRWLRKNNILVRGRSHTAWNKGLTAEIDDRVEKYAKNLRGTHNPMYGRPGWNKGLTKETDVRLKENGRKISKIRKEQFASGELSPWNKGTKGLQIPWNKGSWKEAELNKENLEDLYLNKGFSARKIAGIIGCSQTTVYKRLIKHGIPRRSIGEANKGNKRPDLARMARDPAFVSKRLKSCHKRPTKPERRLLGLIEEHGFPFRYCGDGDVILGGKNPDFINYNGRKQLIEVYGDYWHRNDDPQERIDFFKQYGFDTLIIWEYELANPDLVCSRIEDFEERV